MKSTDMKRLIRSIDVKLQYAMIALKAIRNPHLGDKVIYDGIECFLIQGVNSPKWDLLPNTKENMDLNHRVRFNGVHEDEFQLQPLWKRFRFSFMHTYTFYMRNWYQIDVNKTGKISFMVRLRD